MDSVISVLVPGLMAAGAAALAWYLTRVRSEVVIARQREQMARRAAQADLERKIAEERKRAAEESARREALSEFLSELGVEERYHPRRTWGQSERRDAVVLQERLCFRSLPVSGWSEQVMSIDGAVAVMQQLPRSASC